MFCVHHGLWTVDVIKCIYSAILCVFYPLPTGLQQISAHRYYIVAVSWHTISTLKIEFIKSVKYQFAITVQIWVYDTIHSSHTVHISSSHFTQRANCTVTVSTFSIFSMRMKKKWRDKANQINIVGSEKCAATQLNSSHSNREKTNYIYYYHFFLFDESIDVFDSDKYEQFIFR